MNPSFYPELNAYLEQVKQSYHTIPEERKNKLKSITAYIQSKLSRRQPVQLVFICTHNSRRSHLSQVWAAVAARYFGIESIHTTSAGTVATAVYKSILSSLEHAGTRLVMPSGDNPRYLISFGEPFTELELFSKTIDHSSIPNRDFAAVMTCSEADAACPIVQGADVKIPLFFEDPKIADGTNHEQSTYQERCFQIATELFFTMSAVHL